MNELKSVDQHEKEFFKSYKIPKEWENCGLGCPKCKCELEMNMFHVLLSNPPQRRVRCTKCDYIGSVH